MVDGKLFRNTDCTNKVHYDDEVAEASEIYVGGSINSNVSLCQQETTSPAASFFHTQSYDMIHQTKITSNYYDHLTDSCTDIVPNSEFHPLPLSVRVPLNEQWVPSTPN